MQIASYRNTEAGARPKFRKPEPVLHVPSENRERDRREHEARLRRLDEQNAAVRAQVEAERMKALEKARTVLAELRAESRRYRHTIREIKRRACKVFGITMTDLYSPRRGRKLVLAKQFVYYWAVRLTSGSLPEIGRRMGGRDHSTIHYGRDAYRVKRAAMGRALR